MEPVSTSVNRTRTRRQSWGVSAVVLIPVLVLIGLAANAAGSISRPASEVAPVSTP